MLTRRFGVNIAVALFVTSAATTTSTSIANGRHHVDLVSQALQPPALPPIASTDTSILAQPGPYGVGITQMAVGASSADVWYPTDRNTLGNETRQTYDLKLFLSAQGRKRVGDKPFRIVSFAGARDAAPVSTVGPFPIVLFSHDVGSHRRQSSFLAAHLASWGFAVVAPESADRDISGLVDGTLQKTFDGKRDIKLFNDTIRALTSLSGVEPFKGRFNTQQLAGIGHGVGADIIVRWAAANDRVMAIVLLGGGTTTTSRPLPEPLRPTLWIAGENDQRVKAGDTEAAFSKSRSPRRLVTLSASGHEAFSTWCDDRDNSAASKTNKIWAVLNRMFADGCAAPNQPTTSARPVIMSQTVAELRTVFGAGTPGFGLDQATLDALHKQGSVSATFAIG